MILPPYDARLVANKLIQIADEGGSGVSNASLNKLLYFAHGMYLARKERRLIRNDFEAWQYGPVIPIVYDFFKKYGASKIRSKAKKFDPVTHDYVDVTGEISSTDEEFLRRVWGTLGRFTAGELIDLSHEPGSPWYNLWKNSEEIVRPGMIIRDSEILAHFRVSETQM